MTQPAPAGLRARIAAWYAAHRRATAAAVLAVALLLVVAAVGIGAMIMSQVPLTGALQSPTPFESQSPDPDLAVPTGTAFPSPAPSESEPAVPTPSEPLIPALERAEHAPLEPAWGVVTVNGLNVRSGPGPDDPIAGVLNDGALVMALQSGERLQVLADGLAGWVSTGPAEDPWVRATPTPISWTGLRGVASNGSEYLAYGTWAELDYPPYEGGFEQPLLMYSEDGRTWEESHEGVPGTVTSVAGGPDGWVALAYHTYGGSPAFHSTDGRTWSFVNIQAGSANAAAHGGAGWVIVGSDYEAGLQAWRSADGVTWDGPVAVPGDGSQPQLEASDRGYVLFDRYGSDAAASVDGRTWRAIDTSAPPGSWIADVELVGENVLLVTVDPGSGASTLLRGRLAADGSVTWGNRVDAAPFAGARLDSISSGDRGLIALGWDPVALVPLAWTSPDGASWTRIQLPAEAFGGMVGPEPAWGPGGWVALGQDLARHTLWRSGDGRSWSETGGPAPMAASEPACPSTEQVSVLWLMFLRDRAFDCFGDASLSVRGWVPLVEGLGGCCYPDAEPAWLAGAYPSSWLSPGEADHLGLHVYVPPGIDGGALRTHTWVEVVGHFGDPASQECRRTPISSFPHRLESQSVARDTCARRFVIESLSPAEGP